MPQYLDKKYDFTTTNIDTLVEGLMGGIVKSNTVKSNLNEMYKMMFIGIGQAGGRIVAPAHSLGFPTFVINSSKDDFKELETYDIPEDNMIFTGVYDLNNEVIDTMQGTSKDRQRGLDIAKLNIDKYQKLATSSEVLGAQFVWVAASLGGGTGSGAVYQVAKEIIIARENFNQQTKGIKEENSVGLILVIPSSKDAGIAYRRNALQALQELQQIIIEAENEAAQGYETFGAIYVIDNENFSKSTFLKDYKQEVKEGYNVSELKLSNAYTIASIFEFMTFLCLKGSSTVDRNELASLLGTTGFLNIKKDISNIEIEQKLAEYKSDTTVEFENKIKELCKDYAKSFNSLEDVLLDMEGMQANSGIGYAIINPNKFNSDHAREIVATILTDMKILNTHPGVYEMPTQNGLTTNLAYVSKSFPSSVTKRLTEEYKGLQVIEADLKAAREKQLETERAAFEGINLSNDGNRSLFSNSQAENAPRRSGLGSGLGSNGRVGGLSQPRTSGLSQPTLGGISSSNNNNN